MNYFELQHGAGILLGYQFWLKDLHINLAIHLTMEEELLTQMQLQTQASFTTCRLPITSLTFAQWATKTLPYLF